MIEFHKVAVANRGKFDKVCQGNSDCSLVHTYLQSKSETGDNTHRPFQTWSARRVAAHVNYSWEDELLGRPMLAGFYQADLDLPSNGLFRKEPGMLVITRKTGERIHVGRDVVITITHIHKRKVRIGIEAPRSLDVWRDELESHPSSHCDAEVDTAARR